MKCNKCSVEKSPEDFHWKDKKNQKRSNQCKSCEREYGKNWYKNNSKRQVELTKARTKKSVKEKKRYVFDYLKKNPCIVCGEKNPIKLEFDHVRAEKKNSICQLVIDGCGWEALQNEIAKCEVRCANCHKLKTAQDYNWQIYRWWIEEQ